MNKNLTIWWINSLMLLLLLAITLVPPRDPDLFWHLSFGRDFFSGTFNQTDTYSYTMPGHPWVNHSWLLDIIMYQLYNIGGFLLLSIIINSIIILSTFVCLKTAKIIIKNNSSTKKKWTDLPTSHKIFLQLISALIFFFIAKMSFGVRPQMITLLGLALTHHLLWKNHFHNQSLFYLVPLYAIWAQLHAGFSIGLALFMIWILLEYLKQLSNQKIYPNHKLKKNIFIFIICLLVPLINPYGTDLYILINNHLTQNVGPLYMREWKPLNLQESWDIAYFIFIITTLWIIPLSRYQLSNYWKIITPPLLIWGALTVRNIPPVGIIILPLLLQITLHLLTSYQKKRTSNIKQNLQTKIWITLVLLSLTLTSCSIFTWKAWTFYQTTKSDSNLAQQGKKSYPYQALEHLKNQYSSTQPIHIYSEFGWGGYIQWYLPSARFFIDGRMMTWKNDQQEILTTYMNYYTLKKPIQEIFSNTNFILLRKNSPLTRHFKQSNYPELQIIYQDPHIIMWEIYPW